VKWISEPDRGLYDAMNKGLERAAGDFVVFVNAGDVLSPMLDVGLLFDRLRRETRVLIGHTVESWADRKWLRPGLGRERDVYVAPPHQATFYPRAFYESARYRLDIRVAGDCEYTARAIASCGAAYLPTVVCEFALGGLSSSYGSVKTIRLRLRESHTVKSRLKLFSKVAMWHVLPRSLFYGVLALGKYTPLATGRSIHLRTAGIEPVPPSALRSQGG
jgi:glycosyltransferase involved in cell wall biosynthesis